MYYLVILATSTFQEVNLKVSPKGEGFNPIIQTINRKRLAQNLVDYYGKEFLILFDAYSSGTCAWIRQIIDHNEAFQHPLHHLLLIHFLGGSAEAFFKGSGDTPPEYLPFGVPPYPCRNFVCEYHLRDVINEIEIIKVLGMPCATFICPYCGFSYKRKGSIPKENQYSGRIRIVNYGRKWEETVIMLLTEGLSPYQIARIVHCAIPTVLTFGIEHKLLPSELLIKRYPYIPVYPTQAKPDFNARRNHYRQRWLALTAKNPVATRTELSLLDSTCHKWLIKNDADWLEFNRPPSKKVAPTWIDSDDEYLQRIVNAINQIRNTPGRPKQITVFSIGKRAGITKPYTRLTSDKLPKTKAFVAANTETFEQWQERKILWAIQQMRERSEILTVNKVRQAACITYKERKFDNFILEHIKNSE